MQPEGRRILGLLGGIQGLFRRDTGSFQEDIRSFQEGYSVFSGEPEGTPRKNKTLCIVNQVPSYEGGGLD